MQTQMRAVWLIATLYLLPQCLHAEGEDTSVWKSFELIASRGGLQTGSVRINLPASQDGSIADLLTRNSALFVKYYSPGSLATTSMRGMGAQHTAVMWNGINLQSAMNGVLDLNLLPAFFIDQAALETGANASSCGNGAIGGALVLNNELNGKRRLFFESGMGSFSQRHAAAGYTTRYKQLNSSTRILHRYAENDFSFVNYFKPGKPTERMGNNRLQQFGFMQAFSLKLKPGHLLYANIWHLQTYRQLPPVMGASLLLNERQDDVNTMLLLKHEYKSGTKLQLNSKLAGLGEQINYFNAQLPPAYNKARSLIADTELKWQLRKQLEWVSALNYTAQTAFTDGYRAGKTRQMLSLLTRVNWQSLKPGLKISAGNRQLISDGKMAPSTPDLGIEYQVHKALRLKANAASSFRLPSFNDLYWLPGGNPDLLPEKGRKAEFSAEYRHSYFKLGATAFLHRVDNWIMWRPDPASFSWKAENAKAVESRGLELAFESKYTFSNLHFIRLMGKYQFVRSLNTDVYGEDKSTVGKQLFYTPNHTGSASLQYVYRKLRIGIQSAYTGSRFTTADNQPDMRLPAYFLLNASAAFDIRFKKVNSVLEFTVFNLTDKTYTVFENRPMPLRNYQITYKFNINYE